MRSVLSKGLKKYCSATIIALLQIYTHINLFIKLVAIWNTFYTLDLWINNIGECDGCINMIILHRQKLEPCLPFPLFSRKACRAWHLARNIRLRTPHLWRTTYAAPTRDLLQVSLLGGEGYFWPEGMKTRLNLTNRECFILSMRQNNTCYFERSQATHVCCTSWNPCRQLAAFVGSFSKPFAPSPPPLLLSEGTLRCLLGSTAPKKKKKRSVGDNFCFAAHPAFFLHHLMSPSVPLISGMLIHFCPIHPPLLPPPMLEQLGALYSWVY